MSEPSGDEQRAGVPEAFLSRVLSRPLLALTALTIPMLATWGAYAWRAGPELGSLPVDNRLEVWFGADDPSLLAYEAFRADFGNDETIVIALRSEPDVFQPEFLEVVHELSARLSAVPAVEGVTSLSTVLYLAERDEDTVVFDRMYAPPVDAAVAAQVRERVLATPSYRQDLISSDEQTTLLSARIRALDDPEKERRVVLAQIRACVTECLAGSADPDAWAWGGVGVITEALDRLSVQDTNTFFVLSAFLVAILLWLSLRRLRAVAIAAGGVYMAILFTLGLYLGLGNKLNVVTSVLAPLVLVVGLTDSIYYVVTYYQQRSRLEATGLTKREAVIKSMSFCFWPGLFNTLAASAGFLAFCSAKMAVIQTLGIFAGLGVALCFLSTLVVTAVGLDRWDVRPPERGAAGSQPLERLLGWFADMVPRRRRILLLASVALFGVTLGGVAQLHVDHDALRFLPPDHEVRQHSDTIERDYGPFLPMELVLDTGADEGIQRPDVLNGLDRVQERTASSDPLVRNSISLVHVVKQLNRVFAGGDESYRIPDSQEAVAQELLWYDPDRSDDPMRLVDARYQRGRLVCRVANIGAADLKELYERIDDTAREELPGDVELKPAGYGPVFVKLVDFIIHDQISSLSITFVVVFFLIAVLFRSFRYALVSIPANALPLCVTLGAMGYIGIDLDAATVLVAPISLGIAVDDTIHFLFKYRSVYEETGDGERAVKETIRTTGVAIVVTSLVLAAGCAVVGLAEVKIVSRFGLLTGLTLIAALVGELLVTPAMLLAFGPGARK